MQTSEKIQSMRGLDGGSWTPFLRAKEMLAAGESVIDLTIGDHDIKTPPELIQAMNRSALSGRTGYAEICGVPRLREEIAQRIENRTGITTTEKNVVITNGGQGALILIHLALLNQGDKALYGEPYYPTYPNTIRAAGGRPIACPMPPEFGFQPNRSILESLAPGVRTILFNSPNNPTGAVYPMEKIKLIADVAQRHHLWVISDEVYDTQVWQGEHVSIRSLKGMADRCFVIGSMSKAFAMTGFRIGWLVGPEEVMQDIAELITVVTFGVPEFVQDAALHALQKSHELEQQIAAPFKRRRAAALEILKGRNAVSLSPPDGAMYLMLNIRQSGMSGKDFADLLLARERVAVMPGESFGATASGHVRVAMTENEDKLTDALDRLASLVESLANSNRT